MNWPFIPPDAERAVCGEGQLKEILARTSLNVDEVTGLVCNSSATLRSVLDTIRSSLDSSQLDLLVSISILDSLLLFQSLYLTVSYVDLSYRLIQRVLVDSLTS